MNSTGESDPEVAALIRAFGLEPHPCEGGYFRETYRASARTADGGRSASTAIYYLLTPGTYSAMHRLSSDEVFHFYAGDPVEQLRLYPDGRGEIVVLANDLKDGSHPQSVVFAGTWQGARLREGGRFALLGCTVAPGFDYADYESGSRAVLTASHPAFAAEIAALTPPDSSSDRR